MDSLDNNKFDVFWTQNFKIELQNIFDYITFTLHAPIASQKLYKKIMASLDDLKYFPKIHPKLKLFSTKENLRTLFIGKYVIIYKIKTSLNQIFILHIFHCSQNYLDQL